MSAKHSTKSKTGKTKVLRFFGKCAWCGKTIGFQYLSQLKACKYCSVSCGKKRKSRPDLAARNRANPMRGDKNPFYGKTHSKRTRQIISASQKKKSAFFRLNKDPNFRQKRVKALQEKLKDPECQARRMQAILASQGRDGPNKMEQELDEVIQRLFPGEYEFTGGGTVIIGGLNPDWTNVKGQKKLIELFGEHVHHTKKAFCKVPRRGTYKGRKEAYREVGYEVAIIWCEELKDPRTVESKLRRLHENRRD